MSDPGIRLLFVLILIWAFAVVDWAFGGDLTRAVWRLVVHRAPRRPAAVVAPRPATRPALRALTAAPSMTPDEIDALIAHVGRHLDAVDVEVVDEHRFAAVYGPVAS